MDTALLLDPAPPKVADAPRARAANPRMVDDKAMLKAAAEIARDLNVARPGVYWTDLLLSVAIGYGALALAATLPSLGWSLAAGLVSMLALYRAISFIHELSHLKDGQVPGFRAAWNAFVGVPLLMPSFMYENVHTLHHARTRYGTAEDPEYLPLALMKPWTLPLFVLVAGLAPIGFLIRYAVLSPLSLVVPGLRRIVVERYSALAINPGFRRRMPEGAFARQWARTEAAASLWAIALLTLTATGVLPLRVFLTLLGIVSAVGVVNQVRTMVAHLWENDGEPMSVTAQYLDSVNVPPPAFLPFLWAPVGLRYHGLHHLLPSLPYHSLGEAHRRLSGMLEAESPYHRSSHTGLPALLSRLVRSTMGLNR
jgi:fatty acid desaturase